MVNTLSVVVVGLRGNQPKHLRRMLQEYHIEVQDVSTKEFLKRRRLEGPVFLATKFVDHKHTLKAKKIGSNVIPVSGGVITVFKVIISYFGFQLHD